MRAQSIPAIGTNQKATVKNCNLCGGDETRWLTNVNGLPFVRCSNCGFVYLAHEFDSESLRVLYDDEYYHEEDRCNPVETHWMVCKDGDGPLFDHVLRQVAKLQPTGSILDVGCSYGFFLVRAMAKGYTPFGVELARVPFEYCRDELHLNVVQGSLETATFADDSFHVVTMLNVFEHVPDPMRMLNHVYRLLAPGGAIAIVVPNLICGLPLIAINRFMLRRDNIRSKIALFDVPRHLSFFSGRTLRSFLEKAGFTGVRLYNAPVIRNQSRLKTAAKFGVKIATDLVYYASFRRLSLSYSIAAIAVKPPSQSV
jgi:2-polyprenyl-3-methyl-5-hydroxy-6-metoxy-1,4-benzoquinol methylase